jgi:methionyl-tRNA formyltransferase
VNVLLLGSPALAPWLREQGDEVIDTLDGVEAIVSHGYPRILPADVLERAPGRAVNLHISLLPWNRGSDPNLWSFLEDTPKGVTVHHMDPGVDTGDIVAQRELVFGEHETLATTYATLQAEVQALFREYWPAIRAGTAPRQPQPPGGSFHREAEAKPWIARLPNGWDTPVAEIAGLVVR